MMKTRRKNIKHRRELERVKRRLDEGINISLSPSSGAEEEGMDENGRASELQFETMSSSVVNELMGIMSDLSDREVEWPDASDPDLEGALVDLAGPGMISNPFQLIGLTKNSEGEQIPLKVELQIGASLLLTKLEVTAL